MQRRATRLLVFFIILPLISKNLLYLVYSQPSSSTLDAVVITSVSTILANSTSTLQGSFNGGTALYIRGLGFDSTDSNNIILVGANICNTTAKGVTSDTITCDTTAAITSFTMTNLPITVAVAGKPSYTCTSSNCLFSYTSSTTPILKDIYPRSGTAFDIIKFYGTHRISDLGEDEGINGRSMGDVRALSIGNTYCNRFDILEPDITPNSDAYISCSISPVQAGGYYNVTEWVVPGIATNWITLNYGSVILNLNY
jgi:hypothetical protein